jgi:hypothetical protein
VWSIFITDGYSFQNTFKILPLKCYDGILGMDWLSTLGTMQVDWKMKWLSFTLNDQYMFLQGKLPANVECSVTEMYLIQQAAGDSAELVLPEELQQLLANYQ